MRQVKNGLTGLDISDAGNVVIAYEPVWAIGTGRASSGENANKVIRDCIRSPLADLFGSEVAREIRILYGGSVTGTNANEFFTQPDVDGALVGGASLKAEEFATIVQAARKR
jgi:triosephosphate isomerase